MRFDRFLNVVYHIMVKATIANAKDDNEATRQRRLLDQELNVQEWRVPGARFNRRVRSEDEAAPGWWRGDEDASQTFLHAMGIVMRG